jgi:uncharacterized repeat protein (TIGR01451 family)
LGENEGVTVMEREMGVRGMRRHWGCLGFMIIALELSFLFPAWTGSAAYGKSVFAVAGHANGKIKAYHIDGNHIDFQDTIPNSNGLEGTTGLCLWPMMDRMFVSFEGKGTISWAGIRNLSRDPATDNYETGITGGNGLGGMAVDEEAGVMYVISRSTNRIYGFTYDEFRNTLIPVPLGDGTDYATLSGVGEGIDIDLDPTGSSVMGIPCGRLYVSDGSSTVRYYNTMNWTKEGEFSFLYNAIGICLDRTRKHLYAGYFNGSTGYSYLMRRTLDSTNASVEKNLDGAVMDIAVDEATGFLYLTTYRNYNGRNGAVEAYDPTNWNAGNPNGLVLLDTENDTDFGGYNNGPAGIAVGPSYKPGRMFVSKVDNIAPGACVGPGGPIVYTIAFHPGSANETNVVITDRLPEGVDFVSASPATGEYLPRPEHRYRWVVGNVAGGSPNLYFTLTAVVNNRAEPTGEVVNLVEAESDEAYNETRESTPICCWYIDGVIYVDAAATGGNIGTSWADAFTDLQSALTRARESICSQVDTIRVAKGTYSPGTLPGDTFAIPARATIPGVSVYGGYRGGAVNPDDRRPKEYRTILSGLIDVTQQSETVVTMKNNSLLDGVTVRDAAISGRGILGQGVDFTVLNCIIEGNQWYGIYTVDCNVTLQWCTIRNNGYDGVFQDGANKTLSVENCQIYDNQWNGINIYNSIPTIRNNMIYRNGSAESYFYGIYLNQPSGVSTIRNNTIVDNQNEGIRFVGSISPSVRNCILYANHADGGYVDFSGFQEMWNCCLTDANDLQRRATPTGGNGNLRGNPLFENPDLSLGDFHLKTDPEILSASPCINAGSNADVGTNEKDIDNEARIYNSFVDIGADEAYCMDWNADGVVNMNELYDFSAAWMTQSSNPKWNPLCNLDGDNDIDLADLVLFVPNWLWTACWRVDLQAEPLGMMISMAPASEIQTQPLSLSVSTVPMTTAIAAEKPIREQVFELKNTVEFLERIWLTDDSIQQDIEPGKWQRFMNDLYQNYIDLQKTGNQTLTLKEVEP